ncbi:MAG: endolytic transglycosylase MltG [Bryobacteraceae bacterium]
MKKIIRLALILFVVGLLVCVGAIWSLGRPYFGAPGETFLRIEHGSGTASIARTLQKAGVIHYEWQLLLARAMNPSTKLQAGEYRFAEPSSVLTVLDRIHRGDVYYFEVTVPEGSNRFDIARLISTSGTISSDEFMKASADPASIHDLAPKAPSLEGFLFPATYRLTHSTTAADLCHLMSSEFRRQWKKLDSSHTADALKTITLASLVEKETGAAEERPIVAGVFTNRVAKDMRLDCDPTTIYAALLDNRYTGVIHKSDLLNQNPYNTYQNAGLPPGPIANPGAAAIEAALHPAATEYLFFVAKAEGGGHVFSATRSAHEKAVLAYRHAKHKAG